MRPASVKWKKEISAGVSERDYSARNLDVQFGIVVHPLYSGFERAAFADPCL
jgi:hypothetical protein